MEVTGEIDDQTYVQFYSSKDCTPGTETASSEDECVIINVPDVDSYQSFQVLRDIVAPPIEPSITINARDVQSSPTTISTQNLDVSKQQTKTSVAQDAQATEYRQPVLYHGRKTRIDGSEYILHQVAAGSFSGVPIDQWDPKQHVEEHRNLAEILASKDMTRRQFQTPSMSPRPLNVFEERQIRLDPQCRVYQHCTRAMIATGIAVQALSDMGLDEITAYANAAGLKVWEVIKNPWVQQFTAGKAHPATDIDRAFASDD